MSSGGLTASRIVVVMSKEDAAEAIAADLATLDRAFSETVVAVQGVNDPNLAFECATELVEALRRMYEVSGELRAEQAARIFDAEKMSLAGLADRIGVSKARAAQLVNTAKSAKKVGKSE